VTPFFSAQYLQVHQANHLKLWLGIITGRPNSISDFTTVSVLELCTLFTLAGSEGIHVLLTHSYNLKKKRHDVSTIDHTNCVLTL